MIIKFKYMANWCTTGTMMIDIDSLYDVALVRGQGFNKKKTVKLLQMISENADDDAIKELKIKARDSKLKKINEPLSDLILDIMGDDKYADTL